MTPKGFKRSIRYSPVSILFYCFLISVLLLSAGCRDKEEKEVVEVVKPVKFITVEAGQETLAMSLPGRVRAARRSELSFKVSGDLSKLPIEEGQVIKKGEIVAQLLPRDFQTAVNEAKARELEAEQQYRRYKELYAKKQVSKADFDRYRALRDVARARLDDAQNALKDTTLIAPFDGVIAKRYVENFEKVQAKDPIAFLQLIEQLEILIDVPELMMARFQSSDNVKTIASFESISGKSFPITVKEYSTEADPATQTYQVVLVMDQPEEANILPGMTAKVTTEATETVGEVTTILIPAIAVLNDPDGKNYVWLLDQEKMTPLKTLVSIKQLEGTDKIYITEGLTGGEQLIIAGITQLREGIKVRPWEGQREGK